MTSVTKYMGLLGGDCRVHATPSTQSNGAQNRLENSLLSHLYSLQISSLLFVLLQLLLWE